MSLGQIFESCFRYPVKNQHLLHSVHPRNAQHRQYRQYPPASAIKFSGAASTRQYDSETSSASPISASVKREITGDALLLASSGYNLGLVRVIRETNSTEAHR